MVATSMSAGGCSVVRLDLCLGDGVRMLIPRPHVLNASGSSAPKKGLMMSRSRNRSDTNRLRMGCGLFQCLWAVVVRHGQNGSCCVLGVVAERRVWASMNVSLP